jgi:hypothetical protein
MCIDRYLCRNRSACSNHAQNVEVHHWRR